MRFSIVTCTYNSQKYLEVNINSVKTQNFSDFEHIFIDGFSTDKTAEIIKKYQAKFPDKVKFFQFEPKGIGNAMNKEIEQSSGEYISHLHSDDSFYSNDVLGKIDKFIKKNNNPDLIYGKANFFKPETQEKRIIPHREIYHNLIFWLLLITNYIPHQAVFIKKNTFEKYGKFDEQYKNSMDYEMWLRLAKNKIRSEFLDEVICNFSVRSDSQSTIGEKNSIIEDTAIRKKYIKSKVIFALLTLLAKINSQRKMI